MRAPYTIGGSGKDVNNGIYAYFTAGYGKTDGVWNEMNFGFHPDRDEGGTKVSCEHHDDTGGYKETSVDLGFNYRESFNTFVIKLRKGSLEWVSQNPQARALPSSAVPHSCACFTLHAGREQ